MHTVCDTVIKKNRVIFTVWRGYVNIRDECRNSVGASDDKHTGNVLLVRRRTNVRDGLLFHCGGSVKKSERETVRMYSVGELRALVFNRSNEAEGVWLNLLRAVYLGSTINREIPCNSSSVLFCFFAHLLNVFFSLCTERKNMRKGEMSGDVFDTHSPDADNYDAAARRRRLRVFATVVWCASFFFISFQRETKSKRRGNVRSDALGGSLSVVNLAAASALLGRRRT